MGIDVGGNTITQASGTLTVDTGVPMSLLSTGPVVRPNQCQFIAIGQSGGWVDLANGWNKISTFTGTLVNVSGCYDAANSRFSAPVDGSYFFQVTGSHLLKDGASASYYWHPIFTVNGSGVTGTASGAENNYRLRGHGVSIGSYHDGSIQQVYQLFAGDYVEWYVFSNGSPLNRYYAPYQQWGGFLLG